MQTSRFQRRYLWWLSAWASLQPLAVHAQSAPDAGQIRQQIERNVSVPRARPGLIEPAMPPAMAAPAGPVVVQQFRYSGNTLLDAQTLDEVTRPWLSRPLQFSDLQQAAAAVAAAYREAGWVVRAYLPRQEITQGEVHLLIVEARFGKVTTEGDSRHREIAPFVAMAQQGQSPGGTLSATSLDRALLLLSDLPGVEVVGILAEGAGQAESDLILRIKDKPWWSGDAQADNTGSRSTGAWRLSADMAINSPLGKLDHGLINLAHTQGSDYTRLAYFVPAGSNGLRLGASASVLQYQLVGADFEALQARGDSTSWGMELNHPVWRTRDANVNLTAAWEHKTFKNVVASATTSDYRIRSAHLGINGHQQQGGPEGSLTQASLNFTTGVVDLDHSANQAADAATTRTAGAYSKWRYSLSRQQAWVPGWSWMAALSGQAAGKNLDSSEKFHLGGVNAVRAYPSGEAGGSDGYVVNLELRWSLPANVTLTGFYDAGAITVNHHNNGAGSAARNQWQLEGAGLALGWSHGHGIHTKITWARRIGVNPNAGISGKDQDGSLERDRFWLSASANF